MIHLVGRLARALMRRARQARRAAHARASFLRSYARTRPHYIREHWPGHVDLEAATRVAIFVHFDRQGLVHDFVHHYVRELGKAGFATIFVSNALRLAPDIAERLVPVCASILRRDNVGRDFGAFKDALATIPRLDRLESLLLANDSVYGPFQDLGELIGRMNMAEADVWGVTDNWEQHFHLQSYFLLFGRQALAADGFRRFWAHVRHVQAKQWIIDRYEIGLTRAMIQSGLRCRAAFPYRLVATSLIEAVQADAESAGSARGSEHRRRFMDGLVQAIESGVPLNSSHFFWEHLIVRMGCPFLKQELLRDNPVHVPGVLYWEKAVQSVSKYDTDLIARHLERSVHGRAV